MFGVEVAPYDDNYVVSFGDNQIAVWDIRNLDKSILLLTQSKIVSKVSWCPTRYMYHNNLARASSFYYLLQYDLLKFMSIFNFYRRNLLGSLQRESSAIHLHDMQQSVIDSEPSVLWRSIQPGQNIPLTSFSWHPHDENRLIAISYGGKFFIFLY